MWPPPPPPPPPPRQPYPFSYNHSYTGYGSPPWNSLSGSNLPHPSTQSYDYQVPKLPAHQWQVLPQNLNSQNPYDGGQFDFPSMRTRPLTPPSQRAPSTAYRTTYRDYDGYTGNRSLDLGSSQYLDRSQLSLRGSVRSLTPPPTRRSRANTYDEVRRRRASSSQYMGSYAIPESQGSWERYQDPRLTHAMYDNTRLRDAQAGEVQGGSYPFDRPLNGGPYVDPYAGGGYSSQYDTQVSPNQGYQPQRTDRYEPNPYPSSIEGAYLSAPSSGNDQSIQTYRNPSYTVGIQTDDVGAGQSQYETRSVLFRDADSRRQSQSGLNFTALRRSLTSEDLRRISDSGNAVGAQAVPGSPRTRLIGGKFRNVE